ncbi:T6SS immunity protein Tli4 family protein [Variovorax sp. OV329]|uniref:T6SS immunity protein Tli4 family protein n=1 Tax=Variovorax sp. OV329 TaxID=1882825 RepID=UPI001113522D|nr:T6SS immunity protein Tli4 family protein [Variovorax sp. OV329]
MTTITSQRTTHCIGRYLITLPSNFELSTGGWGDIELYYGLDKDFERVYATVKPGHYTNEQFWDEVNKRRFALRDKTNDQTKGSMLLHGEQIDATSALLRRLSDELHALSIKSEVHVLVGSRYVTLEQESYSKDENNISFRNADPAPAEARLKMIASKLLPYQNAERAKPGFCMQGVLFDVGQDDESASFRFRTKDMGDLVLNVSYHAVTGQPRLGPLERKQQGFARYAQIRSLAATLRERRTSLGGASAEEVLLKTTRSPIHQFFYIERRDDQPRTLDRPYFGITLKTGMMYQVSIRPGQEPPPTEGNAYYHPQDHAIVHPESDSSLSDEQALKLWDEVVASVRKR